jgi:general secretion pathway protein G
MIAIFGICLIMIVILLLVLAFCLLQSKGNKHHANRLPLQILIVLFLLGITGLLFPPGSTHYPVRHGISSAMTAIANFKNAINRFHADCGYYPTSPQLSHIFSPVEGAEDSDVLIKRPASIPASVWHGPYLDANQPRKDPWGRPYVYGCPGKHNPDSFDVYSLGPNGKGGDEAIGNWAQEHR